jgi:acetyl esterase/lipase
MKFSRRTLSPFLPLLALGCQLTAGGADPVSRIDLSGDPLSVAPNPTLPREKEGKPPAILAVTTPNIQLHRTSSAHPKGTFLLFPGGGYKLLAIEHEGLAVADLLNASGYDVAILEYSVGKGEESRPDALADAMKALDLLRKRGPEFGMHTDRLGVMGFSAGGHLATRMIHELGESSPFSDVVLIYPAYLDGGSGGPSLDAPVTPPPGFRAKPGFFVLIGDKDKPGWIAGAKAYADAVRPSASRVEYHLLHETPHGFGITPALQGASAEWPGMLRDYLGRGG